MKLIFSALLTVASASTAIAQLPSYVPTNGLIGWWPFNGDANDESGNGLNAIVNTGTFTVDRDGNPMAAVALDGASQMIGLPGTAALNTDTFTVSLWTMPNSYNVHNKITYGEVGGALRWCMNWVSNYMYTTAMTCQGTYAPSGNQYFTGVPLSVWSSIVFVVKGVTTDFYLDGQLIGSLSAASPLSCYYSNMNVYFGADVGGSGVEYYDGSFDDIGIWNRALTSNEVSGLFSATPPSPCVSNTPVSFTGLNTSYTINDGPSTLVGTPLGGVFIGPGVNGNSFDPAAAGLGIHSITYTYLDGTNCVNTAGFCTEVTQNVGIGGSAMIAGGVHVFPNPNRGVFTVELELEGLVSMQVIDAAGRQVHNEVFQAKGGKTLRSIDLSASALGRYALRVEHNGQVSSVAFVVE